MMMGRAKPEFGLFWLVRNDEQVHANMPTSIRAELKAT